MRQHQQRWMGILTPVNHKGPIWVLCYLFLFSKNTAQEAAGKLHRTFSPPLIFKTLPAKSGSSHKDAVFLSCDSTKLQRQVYYNYGNSCHMCLDGARTKWHLTKRHILYLAMVTGSWRCISFYAFSLDVPVMLNCWSKSRGESQRWSKAGVPILWRKVEGVELV